MPIGLPVVTAEEMRGIDRHAIDTVGVPGAVLMETAGRAVADLIARTVDLRAAPIVVLAGVGNNGGDGFVVARLLHGWGARVEVLLLGDTARVRGEARVHLDAARGAGAPIVEIADETGFEAAVRRLPPVAHVVDAIFGTGLGRAVEGLPAAAIRWANERRRRPGGALTFAVDLPSGLDADRGVPLGSCIEADHTVTFAFWKRGLVVAPGFTYAGRVTVADIGIPPALASVRGVTARLLDAGCLAPLARRDPLAHKGTHGHLLLVAGSSGKVGAALLAGRAALRAGAGLVTLATTPAALASIEGRLPELMTATLTGNEDDEVLLEGKRVVAIGPGLDPSDGTRALLARILDAAVARGVRVVLDADGLNHVAREPSLLDGVGDRTSVVLTPHPGEAARLLGSSPAEVQSDRVAAALALARRFRAVVALKGARTVIAAADGALAFCPTGGPVLGVGGTGDVLTGCLGALLLDPNLPPFGATAAAVFLHGAAGDDLSAERGARGVLAGEVADALPAALERRL